MLELKKQAIRLNINNSGIRYKLPLHPLGKDMPGHTAKG